MYLFIIIILFYLLFILGGFQVLMRWSAKAQLRAEAEEAMRLNRLNAVRMQPPKCMQKCMQNACAMHAKTLQVLIRCLYATWLFGALSRSQCPVARMHACTQSAHACMHTGVLCMNA